MADISAIELEVGDVTVCCTDGVLIMFGRTNCALCATRSRKVMLVRVIQLRRGDFLSKHLDLAVTHSRTRKDVSVRSQCKTMGFRIVGKMDDMWWFRWFAAD